MQPHSSLLLIGAAFMLTSSALLHAPPPDETSECALSLSALSPCFPYIKTQNGSTASAPARVCCDTFIKALSSRNARCICYLFWDPLLLDFQIETNRLISMFPSCGATGSLSASSWIHNTCRDMETLPPLSSIAPASTRAVNLSTETSTLFPLRGNTPRSAGNNINSNSDPGNNNSAKVAKGLTKGDQVGIVFLGIILLTVTILPLWFLCKIAT